MERAVGRMKRGHAAKSGCRMPDWSLISYKKAKAADSTGPSSVSLFQDPPLLLPETYTRMDFEEYLLPWDVSSPVFWWAIPLLPHMSQVRATALTFPLLWLPSHEPQLWHFQKPIQTVSQTPTWSRVAVRWSKEEQRKKKRRQLGQLNITPVHSWVLWEYVLTPHRCREEFSQVCFGKWDTSFEYSTE